MKHVLWLSQHQPLPRQIAALRKKFGSDVDILRDVNSFSNAADITRRYQKGGYDDLVVVAPWTVIGHLCELGLRPLYAVMLQVRNRAEADFVYRGRMYRFVEFRRVRGVSLEFIEGEEFTD